MNKSFMISAAVLAAAVLLLAAGFANAADRPDTINGKITAIDFSQRIVTVESKEIGGVVNVRYDDHTTFMVCDKGLEVNESMPAESNPVNLTAQSGVKVTLRDAGGGVPVADTIFQKQC